MISHAFADDFSSKLAFSKHSFRNTIRVPKGWDPDHDRRSVGADLGQSCLQKLSEADKCHRWQGKS